MAIKDYVRPPSSVGSLQAPKIKSYGDALAPIANHVERLVQARDKKAAAQKEMDFQFGRDEAKRTHDTNIQRGRFDHEENMADTEFDNQQILNEQKHEDKKELTNIDHENKIKQIGATGNQQRRTAGYTSGLKTAAEIAKEGRAATRKKEDDAELLKSMKILHNPENSIMVYSKPASVRTKEIHAEVDENMKPVTEKINQEKDAKFATLESSTGVSYIDWKKKSDTLSKDMESVGLKSSDFNTKTGTVSIAPRVHGVANKPDNDKTNQGSVAEKKHHKLVVSAGKVADKMSKMEAEGKDITDPVYAGLQEKYEGLQSKVKIMDNLLKPENREVARVHKAYKGVDQKFINKIEVQASRFYKDLGVDKSTLSTDDTPIINLPASITNGKKRINYLIASGVSSGVIKKAEKELNSLIKMSADSAESIEKEMKIESKRIEDTERETLKNDKKFAMDELAEIRKLRNAGKMPDEEYKKKSTELKEKINSLSVQIKNIGK